MTPAGRTPGADSPGPDGGAISAAEPEAVVAPTLTDPFARDLSEVAGGPVGRHARPHRWWIPVRVLLALFSVGFALTLVQHQPCLKTNWTGDQARYAKMCYSDVPYMYAGRGFIEGLWPYEDNGGRYQVMEYPVGISYLAYLAAKAVQLDPSGPPVDQRHEASPDSLWSLPGMTTEVNTYFLFTALLLCLMGLASTWLLARVHPHRPWDALLFVLSPCLYATVLINWDLLPVLFVVGAMWAWSRDKPLLTGVLIGLGTAAKLYPLFLLGPILVICWRERRLVPLAWAALGTAAAMVVANLPAYLTGPEQWKFFWEFNQSRGADLGSVWLALAHQGTQLSLPTINVLSMALFVVLCGGVAVLGLAAPKTPRLAQLALLVVAAFLLVNKVYSPQYVLWLLPLAVLARPRWRDLLIWQAGELFYFAAVWWYLGGWLEGAANGSVPVYDLAIWVRVAAELYLVAVVIRDILRPEHDPVRRTDPEPEPGAPDETESRAGSVSDAEPGAGPAVRSGSTLS